MAKKLELLRLYNLKKGAEIHGMDANIFGRKKHEPVIIKFDHVDGMYSFNYVLDMNRNTIYNKDKSVGILHLARLAILKKVDGHYEMASEEEAKAFKD